MTITPELRHQTALTILNGLLASGHFTTEPDDEGPTIGYDKDTGCIAINEALELADEFLEKLNLIEGEETAKRN